MQKISLEAPARPAGRSWPPPLCGGHTADTVGDMRRCSGRCHRMTDMRCWLSTSIRASDHACFAKRAGPAVAGDLVVVGAVPVISHRPTAGTVEALETLRSC